MQPAKKNPDNRKTAGVHHLDALSVVSPQGRSSNITYFDQFGNPVISGNMTYFIAAKTRKGWREERADTPSMAIVKGFQLRDEGAKEVIFRDEHKKYAESELEILAKAETENISKILG